MKSTAINTHPELQAFMQYGLTDRGQLRLSNENDLMEMREREKLSACCREHVYHMDGMPFCGFCGNPCDRY